MDLILQKKKGRHLGTLFLIMYGPAAPSLLLSSEPMWTPSHYALSSCLQRISEFLTTEARLEEDHLPQRMLGPSVRYT